MFVDRKCPICGGQGQNILHNGQELYTREYKSTGPKVCLCNCGMIYLNPIMNETEYERFYNCDGQKNFANSIINEDYDNKIKKQAERRYNILKSYVRKDYFLADVGCGYSSFLSLVSKKTKNAWGIEPSQIRYNDIKKTYSNVIHGTIKNWKKGPLDIITVFQVLEHIVDPNDFMECVKNILSEKGKMIIEVPNHNDLLVGLKKYKRFYYQNAHCSYFNDRSIKNLLSKFDFKIERWIKIQRYSLSNHLHWLIFGKPGQIKYFKFLDSMYSWFIKKINLYDTMFIIVRKN